MKRDRERMNGIATDCKRRNIVSLSMRVDNWPTDSTALPKDEADDEDVAQQPHGGVVGA